MEAAVFEKAKMSHMTTSDRVTASREAKRLILAINEIYKETKDENLMETDINLYGMIAQEVETALDKVGHKNFGGWSEEEDGSQKLAQSMFIYPLINAIQELSAEVEELKAKLKD